MAYVSASLIPSRFYSTPSTTRGPSSSFLCWPLYPLTSRFSPAFLSAGSTFLSVGPSLGLLLPRHFQFLLLLVSLGCRPSIHRSAFHRCTVPSIIPFSPSLTPINEQPLTVHSISFLAFLPTYLTLALISLPRLIVPSPYALSALSFRV